jgi:hypothetical protein
LKVTENNTAVDSVLGIKRTTIKDVVELPSKKSYNSSSVKLQSQIDAHIHYTGQVTSRQYEWARAGSIVPVDVLDAPYLLEKRIKSQSCCSGSDLVIFIQVN